MAESVINKHGIIFDTLLPKTQITGTGGKTLSKDVNLYDAILVQVYNTPSSNPEGKSFLIPKQELQYRQDCSWPATDSITWYVQCVLQFATTTMSVIKFSVSGFAGFTITVYGVKIV